MDIGLSTVILFVLFALGCLCALAETSLENARSAMLEADAAAGDKSATRALVLLEQSTRYLSACQVVAVLSTLVALAVALAAFREPLAEPLAACLPFASASVCALLATIIVIAVMGFALLVVCVMVPHRVARTNPERVLCFCLGFLGALRAATAVFAAPASAVSSSILRILRVSNSDEAQNFSEEEIKYLVTDNDELIDDEKRMIHEIIELGDTTAREIMRPRVDMILVEDTETVRQALDRMRGTGYSRLPVYHEDYDNIVGVIHFKDLLDPLMDGKADDKVIGYAFEPLFVPESKDIYPLLSEMQTSRQQIAIVVDEYGGTDGLITLEDIVEEIVAQLIADSASEP